MKSMEQYDKYRPQIETGDLMEIRNDTLIGGAIRLVTGQSVNHTAVVVRLKQYYSDRVFLLEALEMGITLTLLSRRLEYLKGAAFWLPLKKEHELSRPLIGMAALDYVGVRYDWLSILKQLLGRVVPDTRRLFCSEHAYLSLLQAGLPVKQDHVPWPGEMHNLGVFESPIAIKEDD